MDVAKIEMVSGEIYYCESDRVIISKFMKKNKGIAKMTKVEMSESEYNSIPVSSGSYLAFK